MLAAIKGFSERMINRFLAEIENIKRFSSAKKLIKYAGLEPVIKQSGKWKAHKGVYKKGSPLAHGLVIWNEVFKVYYRKKKERYESHRKAMIAVVNKMLRVFFAIISKGERFRQELVASYTIKKLSLGGSCA